MPLKQTFTHHCRRPLEHLLSERVRSYAGKLVALARHLEVGSATIFFYHQPYDHLGGG